VLFNWFTFFAQIVNFLILVYLLWRFLYRPINKVMDDRQRQLQARWNEAGEQQEKAQEEAKAYRQQKAELESQRESLIAQAKAEAEETRQQLRQSAREEIQQRREQWQEALRQEQTSFYARSRQKLREETMEISRRVLQDLANADLEEQAIRLFLERLQQKGNSNHSDWSALYNNQNQDVVVWSGFQLSPAQREQIVAHFEQQHLARADSIHFETNPDLIFGIEARFGDRELGWNVDSYLQDLDRTFSELFETPETVSAENQRSP
jgi:F-type H+-transporting ATPase subunit b